jgi:hypothetical protein
MQVERQATIVIHDMPHSNEIYQVLNQFFSLLLHLILKVKRGDQKFVDFKSIMTTRTFVGLG